MKKLFLFVIAAAMIACTTNKKAINSKELQGKYEVDISAFFQDDDDEDDLTSAFVALLLSEMKMTMQVESEKLIIDASGAAVGLINAFAEGDDLKMPLVMEYKIKDDSILYVKGPDDKDFYSMGVIRKLADSYDYLQIVSTDDEDKPALTLRKISETKQE